MYHLTHYNVHSVFMMNTRMWAVAEYKGGEYRQTYSATSFTDAWSIVDRKLKESNR